MKFQKLYLFGIYALILMQVAFLTSCKKDTGLSNGKLSFSVDTLVFDTVFTTVGSTTQNFKFYNTDSKPLVVEEITLMGGSNSKFRINVDGIPGITHKDVEMKAKDSLFVFVEVTLEVNGQTLPMIIEDSIRFKVNNTYQYVNLAVWGQDAYFHYGDLNEGTWPNDKPHVVYNYALVDEGKNLTIQAGTQVHFHKNSILYINKASLNVEGTLENPAVFQGDRLESFYKDVAGQWYGIYFQEALPSTINYAVIKNGTTGIHITSNAPSNPTYTVEVTNTIIQNNSSYGIWLFDGGRVKVENSIISKSGNHGLFVLQGGSYFFNQCHILGYGSGTQSAAVGLRNYFTQDGITTIASIPEGRIVNSVIYGNQLSEIAFDTLNPDNAVNLNFEFNRCVIKLEEPSTKNMYTNIRWNQNPNFVDPSEYKFKYSASNSSLNNVNFPNAYFLFTDLEGNPRTNPTDIGAYQID